MLSGVMIAAPGRPQASSHRSQQGEATPMTTPILQFGTSRFLLAHVDLFVSQALAQQGGAGQALGGITWR